MNLKLKQTKNTTAGITLVALVVTIVVLLILAGISLNLVLGENGIIAKAKDAKTETERDKVATETGLNSLYDEMVGHLDGENSGGNGGTGEAGTNIDWTSILADANSNPDNYKYTGQNSTSIGIGTDGRAVNMDLWKYTLNTYQTAIILWDVNGCGSNPGYVGSISEGEIQGKIPQYIKPEGSSEFLPVEDMSSTFVNCTGLTTAPEIPTTVTEMYRVFCNCTQLATAPVIPSSVTNMNATFEGCTKLRTAPTIPSGVTNMCSTFKDCTSLTTVQTIPSSVTRMDSTFDGCTSLTGELVINANLSESFDDYGGYYYYNCRLCLNNAATADGCNLKLSGTCAQLNSILDTASAGSNISLK